MAASLEPPRGDVRPSRRDRRWFGPSRSPFGPALFHDRHPPLHIGDAPTGGAGRVSPRCRFDPDTLGRAVESRPLAAHGAVSFRRKTNATGKPVAEGEGSGAGHGRLVEPNSLRRDFAGRRSFETLRSTGAVRRCPQPRQSLLGVVLAGPRCRRAARCQHASSDPAHRRASFLVCRTLAVGLARADASGHWNVRAS